MPKLIRFRELREYGVSLSRRQIDRLEADGKFPKRVPLTSWSVAWVTAEIEAWVNSRIDARETGLGKLGASTGKRPFGRFRNAKDT
ncbi:AlpA family transcriptional regulator [Bradyrhizobium sp. CCGUVB14]|uniref:helix-turn-helix transcriptional regulator n=1 Tax=Bradyrhizobium sp. CCGUVB14 TaxID=2949628 RepID=UPI0020B447B6|nr:AlpA family phage regulatory protein [Bradyrhizobium sp. CCGUVB14]MCP3444210.1 AlpA family phage regulatory protein [Bradyrhizobium sp. CCGUVB14]